MFKNIKLDYYFSFYNSLYQITLKSEERFMFYKFYNELENNYFSNYKYHKIA